jgi:Na+-driven multidrug efflux pump
MHIRRATGLGLPASIEQAIRTFSSLLLMSLAASFGTDGLAAYGVGTRPLFFWFTPMIGLSIATAAVVGQNIGAGLIERANAAARISAILGFVGMTAIGLLHLPFVPAIMTALASGAPAVAASATTFGYIYFPVLGIGAASQALMGTFRGAGSTRHSMFIAVATQWVFQMPFAYFAALGTPLGLSGVWWSYTFATVAASIMCVIWYRYGSWRKQLVQPTISS